MLEKLSISVKPTGNEHQKITACIGAVSYNTQLKINFNYGFAGQRQRQRGRHRAKGFMSSAVALHVPWCSSLPFSTTQQREMTRFCVVWRAWTATAKRLPLSVLGWGISSGKWVRFLFYRWYFGLPDISWYRSCSPRTHLINAFHKDLVTDRNKCATQEKDDITARVRQGQD